MKSSTCVSVTFSHEAIRLKHPIRDKSLPMRKINKKGFGLLEALIAFTLLGMASWFFMRLLTSAFKGQSRVSSNVEFSSILQSIQQMLQIKEACNGGLLESDGITPVKLDLSKLPIPISILKARATSPTENLAARFVFELTIIITMITQVIVHLSL